MLSFVPFGTRAIAAGGTIDYRPGRLMRVLAFSAVIDNAGGVAAPVRLEWESPGVPILYSPFVNVAAATLTRVLWIAGGYPTALVADDVMVQQLLFEELQENQTLRLRSISDILCTDPMLVEVVGSYPQARVM